VIYAANITRKATYLSWLRIGLSYNRRSSFERWFFSVYLYSLCNDIHLIV